MLFSGMAGGMAFGSTLGAYLNPIIGWQMEFVLTGVVGAGPFFTAFFNPAIFQVQQKSVSIAFKTIITNSIELLTSTDGKKVYSFIFLNGLFHPGVFAWLGYYFSVKYQLGDQGIGLALLGYGLPGMLMGSL
jgi:predicted MFS family arabinose efflux permease